jgi:hypothetical protein
MFKPGGTDRRTPECRFDEGRSTAIPYHFILIWKHLIPDHNDSLFFFQKYESCLSKIQKNKTNVSVNKKGRTAKVKQNKALRRLKQTYVTTIGCSKRMDDKSNKQTPRGSREKGTRLS